MNVLRISNWQTQRFRTRNPLAPCGGSESAIRRPQWSVSVIHYKPTQADWTLLNSVQCLLYAIYAYAYMRILQLWHPIKNPTPSVDAYLVEKQSCQISSSDLKWQSLRLFKRVIPTSRTTSTRTRWSSDMGSKICHHCANCRHPQWE